MPFLLKKFAAFWLMPLPFCLALLTIGAILTRAGRRPRLGRFLLATAILLLLVFSNNAVSIWLIRPLEQHYPPIPALVDGHIPADLAACRYVAVLGGGNAAATGLSATNELSAAALARIVEGVRLLRVLPGAQLVVSGPPGDRHPSHATVLARAAMELGIDRGRIRLIESAHDTEDESHAVKAVAGEAPVALVTTAVHMPRAVALFRAAGVHVLPCPTEFYARPNPEFDWGEFACDTESLGRSTWAVRERIGYLWIWLRGKG